MISEHKAEFGGYKVEDWQPGQALKAHVLPRLTLNYDNKGKWSDLLTKLLETEGADQLNGLVVGAWMGQAWDVSAAEVVEPLVASAGKLPHFKALFIGDIVGEENEMSWIEQTDISPIFEAFPNLEWLGTRGSDALSLGVPRHKNLKGLVVETGGLPRAIVQAISQAQLPNLEHLELWLGEENYGADTQINDIKPLLGADLFPKLQYLGLRNSEMADAIAQALQGAPILDKIRVLDLSLGILGDKGAQALLDNPHIQKLKKLDLHHHYCSDEMMGKLKKLPCEVDVSEQEAGDEDGDETYRYVAHGE